MKAKIFVFLGLCIIALVGLIFIVYKRNSYSKEILKLEVLASEICDAGDEIEYIVKYKNNGSVRLEDLSLVFEYPVDSLPTTEDSRRVQKSLEDLYPGQEEIIYFKGRLFGKSEDIETANATLSYRPKNLKPFYESKSSCSTKIGSVPITFTFDAPSKVISDKDIKLSLNYFSNLDYPLSDLIVKVEYPSDFEFSKSRPKGIEKNEWHIGLLNKAEGGRIEIFGKFFAEAGEQRILKVQLGIWLKDRFVPLKELVKGIEIVKPRLVLEERINGQEDYIARAGETLHYEISFKNIGEDFFEKLFLVSQLEGPFDFESIRSESGKTNQSDRSILWDWREMPRLQFLGPGEEGIVEFWVNVRDDLQTGDVYLTNPILRNSVSLSQIREEFEVKVNSRLVLSQKGFFENEVFENSGPIPPEIGKSTTYTIIWKPSNYNNDVENAKIRAVLPSGVALTGDIFPEEEKVHFTFDLLSREIVWDIGDISHLNNTSSQRVLAFQVKFTPSENQKGLAATLVNEARITAEDTFTGTNITGRASSIDTTLVDDSSISPEQGIVH